MSRNIENQKRSKKRKINKKRLCIAGITTVTVLIVALFSVVNVFEASKQKVLYKRKPMGPIQIELLVQPLEPEEVADYEAMLTTVQRQADYYTEQGYWYGDDASTYAMHYANAQIGLYETMQLGTVEQELNAAVSLMDRYDITDGVGELTYRKGILLANKNICMPYNFQPGEYPLARAAMDEMAYAAANEGVHIEAFSTYRSAALQEDLFNRYVAADGEEEAARYSSRPGCSDHQTGRAFDIGGTEQWRWAETSFDGTEAAVWLEQNAANYGFILRYPQGKEVETGYMYESWHYRYVGDIAPRIQASGKSLEEYLGLL